jgi:nucleoside-diphosphate-sugar epimerase
VHVFLTGGTGYIGSVLVEHLVAAGHTVSALARSSRSAQSLDAAGAIPVHGSLSDLDVLRRAAEHADAVVHAAVDYSMTAEANATELAAVAALVAGAASDRQAKPVILTSSGLVYGSTADEDATEDTPLSAVSAQPVKVAAEEIVGAAAGVSSIVIRPGLVYGRGGSGLVTGLIGAAASSGSATYVDAGDNGWSSVHVDDLAALYVKVLADPVPGVYNAVGRGLFTFRELAEAIGELTGAAPVSIPLVEAERRLGPLARLLTTRSHLSGARARATYDWHPVAVPLVEDVRAGSYAAPALVR